MTRYIEEEDSDSSRTILIAAGVVAGLIAGAVVAQRLGGWRGVRRLLSGRRRPLMRVLRGVIPSGSLAAVLDVIGIERIVSALLGEERWSRHLSERGHRRRRFDEDLDEYEVDDFERAAAGLDGEDEDADDAVSEGSSRFVSASTDDEEYDEDDADDDIEDDEEDAPRSVEDIERDVLAAFRRHSVLRHRALEIAVDDDGVLELSGWVRAERELRIARRLAKRVEGVTRVIVDVSVRDGIDESYVRNGAGVAAPAGADDLEVIADDEAHAP